MIQVDAGVVAIFVTIILALLAFAFGYGILTNKVRSTRCDLEETKSINKTIDSKLDEIRDRVIRLETKINNGQINPRG